jgi:hypothetical protein
MRSYCGYHGTFNVPFHEKRHMVPSTTMSYTKLHDFKEFLREEAKEVLQTKTNKTKNKINKKIKCVYLEMRFLVRVASE